MAIFSLAVFYLSFFFFFGLQTKLSDSFENPSNVNATTIVLQQQFP